MAPKDNGGSITKKVIVANLLPDAEKQTWKFCVVHIHTDIKWEKTCDELRSMYLAGLAQQVDIICGFENQAWYFRSKNTRQRERTIRAMLTLNLSMDLLTLLLV